MMGEGDESKGGEIESSISSNGDSQGAPLSLRVRVAPGVREIG